MRKSILLLLVASVAGCTMANHGVDDPHNPGGNVSGAKLGEWLNGNPPPSSAGSIFPAASTIRPANAEDWSSERCGYTITFSGKPVDVSKDIPQENFNSAYGAKYKESEYEELAECGCLKNEKATPANVTEAQSNYNVTEHFKKNGYKLTRSSFIENSPLGKFGEYEGTSPSMLGELISRVRGYYGRECILALTVTHVRSNADAPRAIAFLNSTRNPSAPILPIANPTPSANDAGSRLKALKDLLDQKLITPAQYEAKRQAIVDGM